MFVPDVGSALDDLDMEDMIVDTPMMLGAQNENDNDILLQDQNDRAIVLYDMVLAEKQANKVSSSFKSTALLELNITTADRTVMAGEGAGTLLTMEQQQAHQFVTQQVDQSLTHPVASKGGSGDMQQTYFETEVERIVSKVQKAMEKLPATEGNKKVRREIESSSSQVRALVGSMNKQDNVDGVMMKEDEVVVFVSSETSGDSVDKKRKRKTGTTMNAGSVASRIRRKGVGSEVKMHGAARKVKMAVRKCKVPAKNHNTSLALAPPAMGLPTP